MFLKLITPFIDPLTRQKLHFNEDVGLYVPREQLWTELGGDMEFEYDHDAYWPELNRLCKERAIKHKSRWEAAGKQYGASELYLKGDDSSSLAPSNEPEASVAVEKLDAQAADVKEQNLETKEVAV